MLSCFEGMHNGNEDRFRSMGEHNHLVIGSA
jgi:hypothetical protein